MKFIVLVIAAGNTLTNGKTYLVTAATVTNNGNIYSVGEYFVAVGTLLGGVGTVVLVQPSVLPNSMHEELAKRTAANILGSLKDYTAQENLMKKITLN